jgi:hypothetical protein
VREAVVDPNTDPAAKLTGKFKPGHQAKGTIKVTGELAGPGSNCHSVTTDWTATKIH